MIAHSAGLRGHASTPREASPLASLIEGRRLDLMARHSNVARPPDVDVRRPRPAGPLSGKYCMAPNAPRPEAPNLACDHGEPDVPKMKKARSEGLEQYGKIKAALCGWSTSVAPRKFSRRRAEERSACS